MMKSRSDLTAQEKADRGMALSISELCQVTGYGRRKIEADIKDGLPLHRGQIRLNRYWDWVEAQNPFVRPPELSLTEPMNGQQSALDKLRALQQSHDQQAA